MLRCVYFCGLLLLASAVLATPVVLEGGGWSKPQDGLQARFTFLPGEALNGTRLVQVYLELHNVTNRADPLYVQFSLEAVTGRLLTADGKEVPNGGGAFDMMEIGPVTLALPYDSTIKLNVTANGWGVPANQLAQIQLINACWDFKPGDTADYFLAGRFTSGKPDAPKGALIWTGTLDIPKARVDVLHPDAAKR